MTPSRRMFLSTAAGSAALAAIPLSASANSSRRPHGLARRIVDDFNRLPGQKGLKVWIPGRHRTSELLAVINPDTPLFCASSFKVFVLAEFLRQTEAGQASLDELLPVDESVWSIVAPVLTPLPGTVTGRIRARTALEAMMGHSDNTATDIALARTGPDRVRRFIASIGLTDTRIPDSTRQYFAYIAGAANWRTIGWTELLALFERDSPPADRIVNNVQTMVSTPDDFVSFYSRALQGQFFQQPATLTTFRTILAQLPDRIASLMPLGVNAFLKGGNIDFGGEHALSLAGGIFLPPHDWAYFSLMINWLDSDSDATADVPAQYAAACGRIFSALKAWSESRSDD